MDIWWILTLLLLLQIKHVIADYVLQTRWIVMNKSTYGHPAALIHAGCHTILSFGVLWGMGLPLAGAALLSLVEGIAHKHIDWTKGAIVKRAQVGTDDYMFWLYLGLDQAVHQISYLAMAAFLASDLAQGMALFTLTPSP